ncbi:demethylmenaquinone methyltransferase [Aquibacillus sp. 3ASR75-11]|uniref:Demethylmenaquinone methyltransferase n=1 Tax=Terrihalobacillus insolitus TaxID=2950438 RepID=A0A9X4AM07_9BACI|nr:demethylmenaquinone methyltransferase [Terrihalobacillus insolitus]MDC3413054.1 demethylmenaquinone methyltransferase [Terrihalobacillus insolitus]MDC3424796.1 demethylmenaquinone methyltransferase [Terrihalobacillus insolitus]
MHQQSKEERVHHVFEKIYRNYDKMNSVISFQRHTVWRKDVMKRMKVKPGNTALDVCCGTGDWSFALSEAVGSNGKVIGLDFSKNMLSVGIEKKETNNVKQLEFIHGNAMELPFEEDTFDFVTIGFGLRNVPDYTKVLQEMKRVVKPGGKVVCLETSQPTLFGFRQVYYLYFRFIMPLFGKLLAKSYEEYAWLHESAKDFPGKEDLKQMFTQVGLSDVQTKSYTGGVAAMHIGKKPTR